MTSSEAERDPFSELISFLTEATSLDDTDARIYALGLKKGIITSGDVVDEKLIPRQTTAADRLRRLANKRFFEHTLDEPRMRGKGHAKKYRAIPPQAALRDLLERYSGIQACIEKIKEHRELLSETAKLEDEIWLLKSQKVAINRVAAIIGSAKESVKIFSHDCTWHSNERIRKSLSKVVANRVNVEIFATEPNERIVKGLEKMGIPVTKISVAYLPFCLIDNSLLLLPCKGGTLSTEYFVILTRQKYLVDNFIKTFNSFVNWSEE